MTRVIVLGGSFGGITAAMELKRKMRSKVDVTLISDSDTFVFIPSLPWLSLGWRNKEDITVPIRPVLERKGIRFVHEEAKGVDADSSKVITSTSEYQYDYLLISTGPALAFDEIPGFIPGSGNVHNIFTLELAEKAKEGLDRIFENPGPIVVGSVQGVSCFGPTYEYVFEIDTELRRRKIRHKVPITFVTSEPYIGHFGMGGLKMSKRWMEDEFANREIKVLTNQAVSEFAPSEIRLKDGTNIPYKLSMFAPAMKGVPAVSHLGNPRGFIPVNEYMKYKKYPNIYCVGVAIAIAPPEPTTVPTGVPKTAYMTIKMAKTAANAIVTEITGKTPPAPYDMDVFCLMDMGNTAAFMRARPIVPPREKAYLKKSMFARWIKIGLEKYYLNALKHGMRF